VPGGGRFALLLGNERFDHARPETGFTHLSGPGHDVTGLAALLADPEIGAFSVVTSIDAAADELRRGIESFLSARRPNDLVLLYYSGHGLRSREGDGLYLAARDTDEHLLLSTSLDTEWLHKVLKKCPARSQVVILDCCHAAAYPGAKGTPDLELGALATAMDGRGRYVLAAARPGQAAYDARHADDPAELGSHYTNVLCEGLRTGAADLDRDGYVDVVELHRYVQDRLRDTGPKQHPQLESSGVEGLVLIGASAAGVSVEPAALSDNIRSALDDRSPFIRAGAVREVAQWLTADPGRAMTARQVFTEALTDRPEVAAVAREHLEQLIADGDGAEPEPHPYLGLVELYGDHPPSPRTISPEYVPSTIAFSMDGTCLITAGNGQLDFWSTRTLEPLPRPPQLDRATSGRYGFVSVEGDIVACAGYRSSRIALYSLARLQAVGELLNRDDRCGPFVLSPDGSKLACDTRPGAIRVWDEESQQPDGPELNNADPDYTFMRFSPDGEYLAVATRVSVYAWDLRTRFPPGRPLIGSYTYGIEALAFRPDSGHLLTVMCGDRSMATFDVRTRGMVDGWVERHDGPGILTDPIDGDMAYSPDGSLRAVWSEQARRIGLTNMWPARPLVGEDDSPEPWMAWPQFMAEAFVSIECSFVRQLCFSPDGSQLAGIDGSAVCLWPLRAPD
jgi:hypothetical protein